MGFSFKRYLVAVDDTLYRLANTTFDRMLRDPASHLFPVFAGQRVRMADVVVELVGREPACVVRTTFAVLTFDDEGQKADEFWLYYRGSVLYRRADSVAEKNWEQACRQRWRALALVIKAKLEAVSAGISVFEDEFLANIVLPDGQLVGQWLRPQLAVSYEGGRMPPLLPGPAA